jgi:hypothetical protein
MVSYITLFHGDTVASARLIAMSCDPALVALVSARMLQERHDETPDPIIRCVERGRKDALRLLTREHHHGQD